MVNKNYVSGRAKEYRIKKQFEDKGYIVLRTAGSHGFADLIAIHPNQRLVKFIQCKPKDFPDSKAVELQKRYNWLHACFGCSFLIL